MEKFTALILSSYDTGEFDRIYTLYTKEGGLLRVVGRGVRKQEARLAGHLEPGTLSEVYVARSRGMGQITSAITISNFGKTKNDFEKLGESIKIFQFFTKNFAEGEKDEKIFKLLREFLENLEKQENGGNMRILFEAFWWKLFDLLGHRPETVKCAKCGVTLEEKKPKYFSVGRGGIACKQCLVGESGLSISSNQTKLLRLILANPLEKIIKVKIGRDELVGLGKIREEFQKYNF